MSVACLVAAIALGIACGRHPLEQAYRYDWLARRQAWETIVEHAAKHPVGDKDALIYVNLAHAYTGTYN
jgi:hypothetical protein